MPEENSETKSKICADCRTEKKLSEFTPTKNDPHKYRPECNECSPARLEKVREGIRNRSVSSTELSSDKVESRSWADIVQSPKIRPSETSKTVPQDVQTLFKLMKNDHAIEIENLKKDHLMELMKVKIDIIAVYDKRINALTDKILSLQSPSESK